MITVPIYQNSVQIGVVEFPDGTPQSEIDAIVASYDEVPPLGDSGVNKYVAPLVYDSNAEQVSIPKADGTTDGYLSHVDFSIFSAKQSSLGGGTNKQFLRGDLTWVNPDASAVQQVYTVGIDANTIQGCIDLCADANQNKIYIVRIPPGQYTENLTMKGAVSLQGMGNEMDTDSVIIFGSHTHNGSAVNPLSNRISCENIVFSNSGAATIFTLTASVATQCTFTGCFFQAYNTSTSTKIFSVGALVTLYLYNNVMRMSGTSNTGGTHVYLSGAGSVYALYGLDASGGTCFLNMSSGGYAQLTNGIASTAGANHVIVGYGSSGGLCLCQNFGFQNTYNGGNGVSLLSNGSTLFGTFAAVGCSFTVVNNAASYVVTGTAPSYFLSANNSYSNSVAQAYNVKIKNTVTSLAYTTSLTSSP